MNNIFNNASFLVYKASAGSGKTFNLAKAYLNICFSHFDKDKFIYRKILGITFTNKAVNEMKSRILLFLQLLSEGKDAELMSHFTEILKPEQVKVYAADLLKLIHHDYSNFSVFTIDSFFERLLRTFAFDLKLPFNHKLELDDNLLMKQAIDMLISKLGHEPDLSDTIINYAFNRMDANKHWRIDADLLDKGKEVYKEESIAALEVLKKYSLQDFKVIRKQLNESIHEIDDWVKYKAQEAVDIILTNDISLDSFFHAKSGIGCWFLKLTNNGMDAIGHNSYVEAAINQQQWTAKTTDPLITEKIHAIAPQLIQVFNELQTYKEKYFTKYQINKSIKDSIFSVSLLHQIKHELDNMKQEEQTMHISETNQYIAKIVQTEAIPYIYERLGDRYKYFFIDEFQDTSILQWQNLLPLISEALSTETFHGETGKAAVFGDVKQAIYRFRGGDVRQFQRLPAVEGSEHNRIINEREQKLKEQFHEIHLGVNYRSREEIVAFNNDFFEYRRQNQKENDSYVFSMYKDLKQNPMTNNKGGGLCLSTISKDNLGEMTYNDYVALRCLEIIKQLQSDGYNFSDIAILTRKNEMGSFINKYLSENAVPVISVDSLLLQYDADVALLLACLSCMYTPDNSLSRAIIIKYICKLKQLPFEEYLSVVKTNSLFIKTLSDFGFHFMPSKLAHLNVYELTERLIGIFDIQNKNNPFVMAFMGVVMQFQINASKQYLHFMEFWEANGNSFSLSNPEGMDAVNVMSIHKAKGLEFPVVIYPHQKENLSNPSYAWLNLNQDEYPIDIAYIKLGNNLNNTDYVYLYEEENKLKELDALNVDYVAYTRAEERLYLITEKEKNPQVSAYFEATAVPSETGTYGDIIYKRGIFDSQAMKVSEKEERRVVLTDGNVYVKLPELVSDIRFETKELRWGNKLHAYLSLVKQKESVDYVKQLISDDIQLEDNEKQTFLRVLDNIKLNTHSNVLFGDERAVIKTEVEILDAEARSFRIDRMVTDNQRTVVIDFKTGLKEVSHKNQVMNYVELLLQIGYTAIEAYLVYISKEGDLEFIKI